MRLRKKIIGEKKEPVEIGMSWIGIGLTTLLLLVVVGAWGSREYHKSIIVGTTLRTTLAVTTKAGEVGIVSYDPVEQSVTEMQLADMEIQSRSIGKYKLSQLYRLGSYEGKGGEFVKKKMQGFLRLPMTDYLVVDRLTVGGIRQALLSRVIGRENATMSRFDAFVLLTLSWKYSWRVIPFETLVKEGALIKSGDEYVVNNTRLIQFVGNRFFDWQVGGEGKTVAVVNETEIDGLGNDIANFLTNVGMDVISVRSGLNLKQERTEVRLAYSAKDQLASEEVLRMIFGNQVKYSYDQDLAEYRSDVVVIVGKDVLEMY